MAAVYRYRRIPDIRRGVIDNHPGLGYRKSVPGPFSSKPSQTTPNRPGGRRVSRRHRPLIWLFISAGVEKEEKDPYRHARFHVMDVEIKESVAFISERESGLIALDISDLQTPNEIGGFDALDIFGLDIDDQYLYASLVNYGLKIYSYEIIGPSGNINFPSFFSTFTLLGIVVYLARFCINRKKQ